MLLWCITIVSNVMFLPHLYPEIRALGKHDPSPRNLHPLKDPHLIGLIKWNKLGPNIKNLQVSIYSKGNYLASYNLQLLVSLNAQPYRDQISYWIEVRAKSSLST